MKRNPFCRTLLISCSLFLSLFMFSFESDAIAETLSLDYTEMSLEDLLNVTVVSAAKKEQLISETNAAIFVITQETLKRSGATSIMDALRMVPGIQVARIDANKWAISARGFNDGFANKLLVLKDGRTLYSPLFSGVFWDIQDTVLEDIERIEVIRGPGATLWGANAVNGVINIITKKSRDTQGSLVTVGAGTEERGFGTVRHGGKVGSDTYYRLFAKYFNRDGGDYFTGGDAEDDWDSCRTGFRLDWREKVTLQGEIFSGAAGWEMVVPPMGAPSPSIKRADSENRGGHLLGRWEDTLSNGSEMEFQVYYDRVIHNFIYADTTVDMVDAELNHRFQLGTRQEIIWGLGYRYSNERLDIKSPMMRDNSNGSGHQLFSGFVQDEISLIDERLRLTIGSKLEHNDYSGFEIQPNIRLLWTPEKVYSVWGSISHAVRTPSHSENSIELDRKAIPPGTFLPNFPGPGVMRITGSSDFDSEKLTAFELGFRVRPIESLFMDFATFYNVYDDVKSTKRGTPHVDTIVGRPFMVVPAIIINGLEGESYGLEVAVDWVISANWQLKAAYSYLMISLENKNETAQCVSEKVYEGSSPQNQLSLMSSMSLPGDLDLDIWARYVDRLVAKDIDSYITADIRLGWHVTDNMELSITGQNLLDSSHPEFIPQFLSTIPTEVERSVYGKITIHF